ncbi:serine/threonine-protein kinase VPS15 isoform X1 [Selaginella moellendorffii]|uniref:serine/threonine-protein kinase VPS15 isoform X1 n=1 Tax=Selaginella moellendorffii TaxID=88036 RepID=UPI000D1C6D11|nr:serine/threonine-protein kinase VPS15 isoform X1 [Selaginella moellendorffii]|eukprot:XP_024526982.1 serine/threonine-protein kinase VPS15 isoform X1 [Selaginella moellendorffii]
MGNKLARTTQASPTEYYLNDLPSEFNLVLKEVIGKSERFFKAILCVHDEGLLLVKVYFKRGDVLDLREHARKLNEIREQFRNVENSHVWPFQRWHETDKAAYLLRQYFFSNLHERLSTRPFLSTIQKKWLAFQLLHAVKQSHDRGVCHGDIKCENVLVTSWNWIYLTDFASFKPTYIPDDNPADFSFFFDTGGRRRCYLAPERFYDPKTESPVSPGGALKPSMDMFSLGCVIAELFLEGQALFDLSQLLGYRKRLYDPLPSLEKISDTGIKNMILQMIHVVPESRLSCDDYLETWAYDVFPSYFSPALHNLFSCLTRTMDLESDSRVALIQSSFSEIRSLMIRDAKDKSFSADCLDKELRITSPSPPLQRKSRSSHAQTQHDLLTDINLLLKDSKSSIQHTKHQSDSSVSDRFTCSYRLKAAAVKMAEVAPKHDEEFKEEIRKSKVPTHEGMVLIASALCACLRHVKLPFARRAAVQLLYNASVLCDDDARLQLIVPFVAALLSDSAAIVRCAALQTLCNVLSMVQTFSPSDAKVFPEYIFPLLSMLPDDPEESVRICYADCIHKIAGTAYRFLVSQSSEGGSEELNEKSRSAGFTTELAQLRETIGRIIHDLVMGQKQTPTIRRALLEHIAPLCEFFGKKQCNDFLLPVLPAFLNDRDKQLRALFFEQIVHVCIFVGEVSSEAYLLPYLEQALSNVEEPVIVNALECLAALCVYKLLKKRVLLKTVERASPLLCHPSQWVRRAAITLVAASGSNLSVADAHAYLIPLLLPFLRREPLSISSEAALLACLKPPVSRDVFQRVLSNVMLTSNSTEAATERPKPRQRVPDATFGHGRTPMMKIPLQRNVPDFEDGEKLKAMEGYIRNLSSTMHSWDLENPEKMDASATGAGFFSNFDVATDSIPLYSRPPTDRRLDNSGNEEWSRIYRQPMDTLAYSQSDMMQKSMMQKSIIAIPSKFTGSIYGRTPSHETSTEPAFDAFNKFLKSSAGSDSRWRPRGVLVSHLHEHQRAVNQVAVSSDNSFFTSASDDGTVKVWDCRRLERSTSFRSKLTYSFGQNERVLCLAMLSPDQQVAAASSAGEIRVLCVDYIAREGNVPERYSGISNVRRTDAQEGSVLALQAFGGMLLYSTQKNGLHLWDFREQRDAWLLKAKPEQGYVSALAADPSRHWLVSGTSRGVLTLWDLRFQVQVYSWRLPSCHPVEAMCVPVGSSLPRPFVYVAAGRNEVAVWNVENGNCQQILKSAVQSNGTSFVANLQPWGRRTGPKQQHQEASKLSDYKVEELSDPPPRIPGVRALLPTTAGASVITGGTDCRIRLWDHLRPETSYCICGPTVKNAPPFRYSSKTVCGLHITQESMHENVQSEVALAAVDMAGCHRDSITSLAAASQLLISSSRDGTIKVWK